jgi:small-conductance mechanosensitive channel
MFRTLVVLAAGAAALAAVSLLLEQFGVRGPLGGPREIGDWLQTTGVRLVFIVFSAVVVVRAAHLAIDHLQHGLKGRGERSDLEWQRRASTIAGILARIVTVTVTFVATLMLLGQLKIDVMPILTGAGIVGLAVGFGAQNLVRDVISGFFLILEDQVRVGDNARINAVPARSAHQHPDDRAATARRRSRVSQRNDPSLANLSKQFAYAVVDVRVAPGGHRQVLQTLGKWEAMRGCLRCRTCWSRSKSPASLGAIRRRARPLQDAAPPAGRSGQ